MSTNDGTGPLAPLATTSRSSVLPEARDVRVERVRVERTDSPWGIDVPPRVSWEVTTSGGPLAVYGATVSVGHSGSTVWSTITDAAPSLHEVECPRDALRPDTLYDVEVEVSTQRGTARASSTFRTGFFGEEEWEPSRWIAAPPELAGPAPLIRGEFIVPHGATGARLYLAAGGFARVLINGMPASNEVLGPGITAYDHRVQYLVWDLGGLVQTGSNALTIELGRGFFGMSERNIWGWETARWSAPPCVRFVLLIDDRHGRTHRALESTDSLVVRAGPTLYDDLYGGETFDATQDQPEASLPGFDSAHWSAAVEVTPPAGRLVHRRQPPIRVVDTIEGVLLERTGDRLLVDFGRIVAGWVRITATGPAGHQLELRYGEKLSGGRPNDDDPLHYYNGRFQRDVVTLRGIGDPETWESRFGWKGFRYVEVLGWLGDDPQRGDLVASVAHNDVERTGDFQTSDAGMQAVHDLTVRTILNNLHSIPTDTPKYEKNGWTADGMVSTEMFLRNLDTHELLAKWVDDIADSRDALGVPSVIAPNGGWTYDWTPAPPWHSAYVLIPWWLYRYGGDSRIIRDHIDGIIEYLDVEFGRSPDGIASTTLGDWVSPETSPAGGNPPEDLRVSATIYLHVMLETAAAMAHVLGREDDAEALDSRARTVREAFLERFFDPATATVRGDSDAGYRQSHNTLALALGLIPQHNRQAVADGLANDVRRRDVHLNTGVLATKYLLPVLTDYGHADLALQLARQTTFPSWGHWVGRGATTLWEHWHESARSHGHYFLGTVDDWFYSSVAGLVLDDIGSGRLVIHPRVIGAVESASARVRTRFGPASVAWQVRDGRGKLVADVPIGVRAVVVLPGESPIEVGDGHHEFRFPVAAAPRDMLRREG